MFIYYTAKFLKNAPLAMDVNQLLNLNSMITSR